MLADRVQENSVTVGLGTFSLSGAPTGRRSFVDAIGSGNPTIYTIENDDGTQWEIGQGVVTAAGPDTLTRASVIASSNANALVNFSAGPKTVRIGVTADLIRFGAGNAPAATGTANARIVAYPQALTKYIDGAIYPFVNGNAANSAAATADLGPGAKNVCKADGTATSGGEMAASTLVFVMYRSATDDLWLTSLPPSASETVAGIVELATNAETQTGSDTGRAVTPAGVAAAAHFQGKQEIPLSPWALIEATTNGAAAGKFESTTNKLVLATLDFDPATIEYGSIALRLPKSWNGGTFTYAYQWLHGATSVNFGVSFGMQAVSLANNEDSDAAFGTAIYVNDTGGTTGRIYTSDESAAVTIAGTPAAGELVVFRLLRKADDGTNDTLAVDARLIGLTIYITTNSKNDA